MEQQELSPEQEYDVWIVSGTASAYPHRVVCPINIRVIDPTISIKGPWAPQVAWAVFSHFSNANPHCKYELHAFGGAPYEDRDYRGRYRDRD